MSPLHLDIRAQYLIRSSFALFDKDEFAKQFYNCLFELAPLVKPMFKSARNIQEKHFITIIASAIDNMEDIDQVRPSLFALGKKHKHYHVHVDHFPVVKSALLLALNEQLEGHCTEETENAWGLYFDVIASIMIEGLESEDD